MKLRVSIKTREPIRQIIRRVCKKYRGPILWNFLSNFNIFENLKILIFFKGDLLIMQLPRVSLLLYHNQIMTKNYISKQAKITHHLDPHGFHVEKFWREMAFMEKKPGLFCAKLNNVDI